MRVELLDVAQTFGKHTLFQGLNLCLEPGQKTVILAGNGAGKSTLLQIMAGSRAPRKGTVRWNGGVDQDAILSRPAFASPYTELIEDLTLEEHLAFQAALLPWQNQLTYADVLEATGLKNQAYKPIKLFSSGMKQRLRLSLALLSSAPAILLDEPVSNLDPAGMEWYCHLLANHLNGRTLVVASNFNVQEYPGADWVQIALADFQP